MAAWPWSPGGGGIGSATCVALARAGAAVAALETEPDSARGDRRRGRGRGRPRRRRCRATCGARPTSAGSSTTPRRSSARSTCSSTRRSRRAPPPGRDAARDWEFNLEINLTGYFLCAREAARRMIARGSGGAIVNISSIAGSERHGQAEFRLQRVQGRGQSDDAGDGRRVGQVRHPGERRRPLPDPHAGLPRAHAAPRLRRGADGPDPLRASRSTGSGARGDRPARRVPGLPRRLADHGRDPARRRRQPGA